MFFPHYCRNRFAFYTASSNGKYIIDLIFKSEKPAINFYRFILSLESFGSVRVQSSPPRRARNSPLLAFSFFKIVDYRKGENISAACASRTGWLS